MEVFFYLYKKKEITTDPMKAFLRNLLEKWKVIATKIAVVQTTIILFIIYFLFFSIMFLLAFITRRDLLDKRLIPVKSYWKEKEIHGSQHDQYKHQF
jgi:hypothetical protein